MQKRRKMVRRLWRLRRRLQRRLPDDVLLLQELGTGAKRAAMSEDGALYATSVGEAAVWIPRALASGVRDAEVSGSFVDVQVFDVLYASVLVLCA